MRGGQIKLSDVLNSDILKKKGTKHKVQRILRTKTFISNNVLNRIL